MKEERLNNNRAVEPKVSATQRAASTATKNRTISERVKSALTRFMRGLLLVLTGVLVGALIGFVVFLLLQAGWELLADWQNSSSTRRRGGDPIDGWASGVVTMMYFLLVMLPFIGVGFGIGLRIAFYGPATVPQLWNEVRAIIRRIAAFCFSKDEGWGRCGLLLAIPFWPVAMFQLSGLKSDDSPAGSLLLLSAMIVAAVVCGIKGLKSKRRRLAIIGLVLTAANAMVICRFLFEIGLGRWSLI